jgi:hypothetical protein
MTRTRTSPAIKHTPLPREGHADIRATNAYLHADMTIKERALALTTPANVRPGRYRPPDALLGFLESL